MAPRKKPATKKRPGRPSKGPTVHIGMRIPKDLWERIQRIRDESEELRTMTAALEEVIRAGLKERR